MRLSLNTAGSVAMLKLDDVVYEWEAGRELAKGLLGWMRDCLAENGWSWGDITELEFFAGPGSFTGLRIGAAVINTLAAELRVPLYNQRGERVEVMVPEYGRAANVTAPRK